MTRAERFCEHGQKIAWLIKDRHKNCPKCKAKFDAFMRSYKNTHTEEQEILERESDLRRARTASFSLNKEKP